MDVRELLRTAYRHMRQQRLNLAELSCAHAVEMAASDPQDMFAANWAKAEVAKRQQNYTESIRCLLVCQDMLGQDKSLRGKSDYVVMSLAEQFILRKEPTKALDALQKLPLDAAPCQDDEWAVKTLFANKLRMRASLDVNAIADAKNEATAALRLFHNHHFSNPNIAKRATRIMQKMDSLYPSGDMQRVREWMRVSEGGAPVKATFSFPVGLPSFDSLPHLPTPFSARKLSQDNNALSSPSCPRTMTARSPHYLRLGCPKPPTHAAMPAHHARPCRRHVIIGSGTSAASSAAGPASPNRAQKPPHQRCTSPYVQDASQLPSSPKSGLRSPQREQAKGQSAVDGQRSSEGNREDALASSPSRSPWCSPQGEHARDRKADKRQRNSGGNREEMLAWSPQREHTRDPVDEDQSGRNRNDTMIQSPRRGVPSLQRGYARNSTDEDQSKQNRKEKVVPSPKRRAPSPQRGHAKNSIDKDKSKRNRDEMVVPSPRRRAPSPRRGQARDDESVRMGQSSDRRSREEVQKVIQREQKMEMMCEMVKQAVREELSPPEDIINAFLDRVDNSTALCLDSLSCGNEQLIYLDDIVQRSETTVLPDAHAVPSVTATTFSSTAASCFEKVMPADTPLALPSEDAAHPTISSDCATRSVIQASLQSEAALSPSMTLIHRPDASPLSVTKAAPRAVITPAGTSVYREETAALSPATMVVDHVRPHSFATSRDMPAVVSFQLDEDPVAPTQTRILSDSAANVAASRATPNALCSLVVEPDTTQQSSGAVFHAANVASTNSVPERVHKLSQHPLVDHNGAAEAPLTDSMSVQQYIQIKVPWDECGYSAQLRTMDQLDDCGLSDKQFLPACGDGRVVSDKVTTREERAVLMPKKQAPSSAAHQIPAAEESDCSSARSVSPFSRKNLRAMLHSVSNLFSRKKEDTESAEAEFRADRPTKWEVEDRTNVLVMPINHKDPNEEQCDASRTIPSTTPQREADVSSVAPRGGNDLATTIDWTVPQTREKSPHQTRQQASRSRPHVTASDASEPRIAHVLDVSKGSCVQEMVDQANCEEVVEIARTLVACVLTKVLDMAKAVASTTQLARCTNWESQDTAALCSALLQTSTRPELPVAVPQAPMGGVSAELNALNGDTKAIPDVRPARSTDAGACVEGRPEGSAEGGDGTMTTSTGSTQFRHGDTSDTTDATSEMLGAFLHSIDAPATSSRDSNTREKTWNIGGGTANYKPGGKIVPTPENIACAPSSGVCTHYPPIAHGSNNGHLLSAKFVVSPQLDALDSTEHGNPVYAAIPAHGVIPPNVSGSSPIPGYVAASAATGNGAFSFHAPTVSSYFFAMPTNSRVYPLVLQQHNMATDVDAVQGGADKKMLDTKSPREYNLERDALFHQDDRNYASGAWFHAIPIARCDSTITAQPPSRVARVSRPPTSRQTKHRVPQAKHKIAPGRSKQTPVTALVSERDARQVTTQQNTDVRTATESFYSAHDVSLSGAPRSQRPSSAPSGRAVVNGTIPEWLVKRRQINRSPARRRIEEVGNSWQKPWGANEKCYDMVSSRFLSSSLLRGKFQFKHSAIMDAPSRAPACLRRTPHPASPTRGSMLPHQRAQPQPQSSSPTSNLLVVHQPLNPAEDTPAIVKSQNNPAPMVQETPISLAPLPYSSLAHATGDRGISDVSYATLGSTRHETQTPNAPQHPPQAAALSTSSGKPTLECGAQAMDARAVVPSTAGGGDVMYETMVQQLA